MKTPAKIWVTAVHFKRTPQSLVWETGIGLGSDPTSCEVTTIIDAHLNVVDVDRYKLCTRLGAFTIDTEYEIT